MCSPACNKRLFIICNIIVWLGGAALLGFGLWMKFDPTITHYLNVIDVHQSADLLDHAATIFCVVGGLAFIAGLVGCCGLCRASQCLLFSYAIIIFWVILAEFTAGAMVLAYRGQVEGDLEGSMYRTVKEEYIPANNETVEAWDFLQETHTCCGTYNYTDWRLSKWWNTTKLPTEYVPSSCCLVGTDSYSCQSDAGAPIEHSNHTESLAVVGCFTKMENWFHTHSLTMTILGLAIGVSQVTSFVTSCCLRSALKKQEYGSKSSYSA